MAEIAELERRITAALERIGRGLDGLPRPAAAPTPDTPGDDAALQQALEAAADREAMLRTQYEMRIDALTRQLDVQGMELQRMRKSAVTLREELRRLREVASTGMTEPAQVNRAMMAELDAVRAVRLTELAELDELAAALDEHLTEAEHA